MSNHKRKKKLPSFEESVKEEILTKIARRRNFSKKDSKSTLDELNELKRENILTPIEYKKYRKEIINKTKKSSYKNKSSGGYSAKGYEPSERKASEREEKRRLIPKEEEEEPRGEFLEKAKKGAGVYKNLKKTGGIRLIAFVVLMFFLLFFVTRSELSGTTNSYVWLFVILFVLFFAMGKGGEKNLFDDFI